MCVVVCRFGTTLLAALVTGRILVVCVGDLSPILRLLIAAVVADAAYLLLPFVRLVTLMCWLSCPLLRWLEELYILWWLYWHCGGNLHSYWGGHELF